MRHTLVGFAILCLAVANVNAQEYRATLLGKISDSADAAVVGARIAVTNTATGIVANSVSNADGSYVVPFLVPGPYTIQIQQTGFKSFERTSLQLRVNDLVRLDVQLQVGSVSERVVVVAETPLLETGEASRGQVVGQRQLESLPTKSGNPLTLINLAAGVQYDGSLKFFRAYDNGSINDFSINGSGESQNNFQLDGLPNNALTYYQTRPQVAYVPPAEAVQEMKILTNTYDAEYGRTAGGIISVTTKAGTNDLHGAGYGYMRRPWLDANTFVNNLNGQPRPPHHVDQYGFELGGPVIVPKLYHGKNRTFFMFAWEGYHERKPQPGLGSVPTAAQRAGDFSQSLNASGQVVTIYDPLTTRPNPTFDPSQPVSAGNPQFLRDPFPNNQIPTNRMNPVALKVLNDIPTPNQAGDPITLLNNWFAGNVVALDDFNNYVARVDHEMNDRWKIFGRWDHNYRNGGRHNDFNWQTPARQFIRNLRQNDGVGLDTVGTLSPQTVLTARVGYHRFVYSSNPFMQDLSYLGLPVTSQVQEPGKYPLFEFTNYIGTSVNENDISPSEAYTAQGTLIRNVGRHFLKLGAAYALDHFADVGRQNGSGTYSFTPGFTSANPQVPDASSGNSIASFLLGYMDSASVNLNAAPYVSWHDVGLFFQDDWHANSRLTLNFGLRWDYQSPAYERDNRQNRGFDFAAKNPIQAPGLNLLGGLLFSGVGQPSGAWGSDYHNLQPRFGVAYRVFESRPLVFRAGVGRYFAPLNYIFGGNIGFAETSFSQTSTPGFQPLDTLSNPFPGGLVQPAGASAGLATNIGNGVQFTDPNWRNPYVWQYSAGFQYEIKPGLLVEASYVGSQTKNLGVNKEFDFLTPQQLNLGAAYLNQAVPNPFFGVLPANTALGAQPTIEQQSLITQYPEFTNVTMTNHPVGGSWYNSLQLKMEQRFKYGLALQAFYTYSKTMEASNYINPQDTTLSRELTFFDVPHRFVFSGVYQFPFGSGQRWLSHGGIGSFLAEGWQISSTGIVQSGTPLPNPFGYFIEGNPKLSSGQTLQHWFNTSPQIWVPIPPFALSNVPFNNSKVRVYSAPQFDVSITRSFAIRERQKLQLRLSAYNAGNTPIFGAPNTDPTSALFGVVPPSQINLPRSVELGVRYAF
jgi:hypothetical protein